MNKSYSKIVLILFSGFCISTYAQDGLTSNKLKRLPETDSPKPNTVIEPTATKDISTVVEEVQEIPVTEKTKIVSEKTDVEEQAKSIVVESKPAEVNEAEVKVNAVDPALQDENEKLKKQIAELLKEKEALKAKANVEEVPAVEEEAKVLLAPSSKFDLLSWTLSVPTDLDGNKRADQIKEKELSSGYSNEYFYLSDDGGMVFKSPIGGFKTSKNTTYTRSELREMLRRGDTKIKTKGPGLNNWVLKSSNSMFTAGGHDAQLKATLKVDHVTTSGVEKQVGRVIIGQIHAEHDEPLRIYYRKLPNNSKGSIYFAHEGRANNKEDYYELIGKKSSTAENPENGIELGEIFSYQVLVLDNILTVKITKSDGSSFEKSVDMKKSGYAAKEEYMYFKAGVYNQNKTGDLDDYVQATFYELSNKHKKYVEPTYDD